LNPISLKENGNKNFAQIIEIWQKSDSLAIRKSVHNHLKSPSRLIIKYSKTRAHKHAREQLAKNLLHTFF
jgi:hypothetical protein